jgi:hypothetical protein
MWRPAASTGSISSSVVVFTHQTHHPHLVVSTAPSIHSGVHSVWPAWQMPVMHNRRELQTGSLAFPGVVSCWGPAKGDRCVCVCRRVLWQIQDQQPRHLEQEVSLCLASCCSSIRWHVVTQGLQCILSCYGSCTVHVHRYTTCACTCKASLHLSYISCCQLWLLAPRYPPVAVTKAPSPTASWHAAASFPQACSAQPGSPATEGLDKDLHGSYQPAGCALLLEASGMGRLSPICKRRGLLQFLH